MKTGKIIAWVVGIAGVAYLATWPICGLTLMHSRNQAIRQIRNADHPAVLAACRALMTDVDNFKCDHEMPSWQAGWKAVVDNGSAQYEDKIPATIKALNPQSISITSNQVYLFYWNSPVRLSVRAFGPTAKQFGTEKLIDGLWLVTTTSD
ncbi:MAG: hypothetical protein WC708_12150 [Lentisphaeria bacterium]